MKFLKTAAAVFFLMGIMAANVRAEDIMNCPLPADVSSEEFGELPEAPVRVLEYSETAGDYDFYEVDERGYTKALSTSFSGDNRYNMKIEGQKLYIDAYIKPTETNIPYGFRVGGVTATGSGTDGNLSVSVDLSSVADGSVDFRYMYKNPTTPYSYWTMQIKEIKLIKEGGELYFTVPQSVYENNKLFLHGNYRAPEYYIDQYFPWVQVDDEIKGWALEITKDAKTDYERIKAVHDWVADNIYYDYYYLNNHSAGTQLNTKDVYNYGYSVCQGYSSLCAGLLRSIGIPCKVAEGWGNTNSADWSSISVNSTNHAWNEAWCAEENRWIVFDATWDSGNTYNKDGDNFVKTYTKRTPRYFDVCDKQFAQDHRIVDYARYNYYNVGGLKTLGDINGDGMTDETDSLCFMRYFIGKFDLPASRTSSSSLNYLDVNGDKKFDFLDAIAQQRKVFFTANVKSNGYV